MWMPVALLVFATATAVVLNTTVVQSKGLRQEALFSARTEAVRSVGNAVEAFLLANARYPNNLTELVGSAQHTELGSIANQVDYVVVTKYDAQLDREYQKAIVFIKADRDVDTTTWLSANDCGTGAWSAASVWCRKDGSYYAQTDSRSYQGYLAQETIVRLDYLAQQIFNGRTVKGKFPQKLSSGADMADGSVTTLATAVGYAGTPEDCSGVFQFDGALISCEAMFSLSGSPVYYQRENNSNAILYIDLPVKLASGEPHRVVRPLRVL